MADLILKDINKSFKKIFTIRNFNLKVNNGEFFVLVGPSGCGKTTILRLISGLIQPDNGEIILDGKVINSIPPKDRDVAMVFQNYALYPHMNVYENIAFPLRMRKFNKEEIHRRVMNASSMLGITEILYEKPKHLSGGEKQRVAVGRAIVRNPKIFLFDEPLSNLDIKLRTQMRLELKRIHSELNATVIYVTHDQFEAMMLGDRIGVMKDGEIQQVGTPSEIYNKPVNIFVACFFGFPPMNMIEADVLQQDGEVFFILQEHRLQAEGIIKNIILKYGLKKLILGIRPEHLKIMKGEEPGQNTLNIICENIEPVGAESYVYFNIGRTQIVARHLTSEGMIKKGEKISVRFDLYKIIYFYKETGTIIDL